MKKINICMFMGLIVAVLVLPLEAASTHQPSTKKGQESSTATSTATEEDDEYDIMERDEIDDTDTLAIPFDDSEVEDEEEIDLLEKKDVFSLPHSR